MIRKVLGTSLAGMALGTFLALTAPAPPVTAQVPGCRCTDDGSGTKKCLLDHSGCKTGSEVCVAICTE